MQKLKMLVSLMTSENDYQLEQANSAEEASKKLGVECKILFADNDAITQSTQILKAIQGSEEERPHAVVMEPVGGTALPQVARAATQLGIGWTVLNRDVDYVSDLRRAAKAPIFGVSSDQLEVGRIQARQCAALFPRGGNVLYIQGPSDSPVAKQRALGMQELKPNNLHLVGLKGNWTEDSAIRTVRSWLKLTTSQKATIDGVVAQNDAMAIGVRKAFEEVIPEIEKDRWLEVPFIGVDGAPKTGQAWVRSGLLTATVFTPPNAGRAVELLFEGIAHGRTPSERVLVPPASLPEIEKLGARGRQPIQGSRA
ncbi:MAG TPA: sugar ABC transporter substrate-binding protein [Dongiaceae bacterium]|nr:sugar ABC transporter substrate-binding protein [Dongiaceae bacterium]